MKDTIVISGVDYEVRRGRKTVRLIHPDGRITVITGKPTLVEAEGYRGLWVYNSRTREISIGQPLKTSQKVSLNGVVVEYPEP